MKKLAGLLLLILSVLGISSGASAATSTSITDWDGYKEPQLQLTINPGLGTGGPEGDLDYDYGDLYSAYKILYTDLNASYRWEPVHVKIYRVDPNNCNSSGCTLRRYKTIYAEHLDSWVESNNIVGNQYRFKTTITTGFPAGRYYAVLTTKQVHSFGSYYYAERSYRFTID
ncbi:DUF5065 family protein [Cytobacillus oceanisediminis]|uniref:DUF5065 family protein n=1 Tax=Cytobacillus oceanisediminis TaxID=665099 RepID=UPI0018654A00|nr:DUF5065 family protein [Cytobacillus oceanisediminis]QOK28052.1 DUF5065 family protein [Cytobacillus oceanisediminis]